MPDLRDSGAVGAGDEGEQCAEQGGTMSWPSAIRGSVGVVCLTVFLLTVIVMCPASDAEAERAIRVIHAIQGR